MTTTYTDFIHADTKIVNREDGTLFLTGADGHNDCDILLAPSDVEALRMFFQRTNTGRLNYRTGLDGYVAERVHPDGTATTIREFDTWDEMVAYRKSVGGDGDPLGAMTPRRAARAANLFEELADLMSSSGSAGHGRTLRALSDTWRARSQQGLTA